MNMETLSFKVTQGGGGGGVEKRKKNKRKKNKRKKYSFLAVNKSL